MVQHEHSPGTCDGLGHRDFRVPQWTPSRAREWRRIQDQAKLIFTPVEAAQTPRSPEALRGAAQLASPAVVAAAALTAGCCGRVRVIHLHGGRSPGLLFCKHVCKQTSPLPHTPLTKSLKNVLVHNCNFMGFFCICTRKILIKMMKIFEVGGFCLQSI
jgi:hypothetical protein